MTSTYLDGTAKGVIRFQRCTGCGRPVNAIRLACLHCGHLDLQWQEASGFGTVYATTTVTRAPSEAFQTLLPYVLVLVDLDEGVRVMAHGEASMQIGHRVRAHKHPSVNGLLLFMHSP